jgi:hypothetical protein
VTVHAHGTVSLPSKGITSGPKSKYKVRTASAQFIRPVRNPHINSLDSVPENSCLLLGYLEFDVPRTGPHPAQTSHVYIGEVDFLPDTVSNSTASPFVVSPGLGWDWDVPDDEGIKFCTLRT